ncbi:methyl-accepting chemotaxis protein [Natranaerovirga hydrolytica]|uniref:Methyl-accepting chemotaxis protein n=1 Tax=Natranaerovirga hydrolytica TaxID=680378 RepID=A0A4R1N5Y9_9FIRM|nr:methyl-accepting chemotaxis protein [Natranaerovirga hydrolytica]TCK98429.1 methyl-accepting chemotaxis protein [Natranaerovirga hydrolytica]
MVKFKKKNNDMTVKKESKKNDSQDVQLIIEIMKDINERLFKSSESFYIDENQFENEELGAVFNQMLQKFNSNKVIKELNDTVNQSIEIDVVSDMLTSVNTQNESLENMVSSSEELKASIEEVSNSTQKIAEFTDESYEASTKTVDGIKNSIDFVKQSSDSIQNVSKKIDDFNEKMQSITKIIDVVKSIAEQTNLLSLNASIEAARAGEHGLGFAVVADEVRNLSENTKSSAIDIEEIIKALQNDIEYLVEDMNTSSEQLENGTNLVEESVDSVVNINNYLGQINDTIAKVANTLVEQDTVMDTISEEMTGLSEEAKLLDGYCNDTGRLIFQMSRLIDKVRGRLARFTPYLSLKEWSEIYKTDHVMFVYRIHNMILGFETLQLEKMNNPKACKLGTWFYKINDEKIKSSNAYHTIEQSHNELHKLAEASIKAYDNGNVEQAKLSYQKMHEPLNKLLSNIDTLITTME